MRWRASGAARLLVIVLAVVVSGCQPPRQRAEFVVFGTMVEVTLDGVAEPRARQAFAELQTLFNQLHQQWHPWQPGALMTLNQALAQGHAARPPPRLYQLLLRAQQTEHDSCGLFNAATGDLIDLWGFHTSQYPIMGPPPATAEISAWRERAPSSLQLTLEQGLVQPRQSGLRLDLSGLAKGAAVELALQHLRDLRVPAALVSAGGDVQGYHGPQQEGWRVAIRDPFDSAGTAVVLSGLTPDSGEAVFTSGNYARFRQAENRRYAHILDPRTGWPVRQVAAVTVVADDAVLADAAATALMVAADEGQWPLLAARMGLRQVMVVYDDGAIEVSVQLARRLADGAWRQRIRQQVDLSVIDAAHACELINPLFGL
ncbi:MAG: FAD:protein FMN transferase [Wenzhouxiangellaceae bacterium]